MAASGASVAAGSVEAKLPPHEQVCAEWEKHIKAILFDSRQIAQRVKELGEQISRDYAGKKVLAVGLLTGCFVFMADLMRHIARPHEIDFMVVSSYGKGTASSGNVKLKKDCSIDPAGQHVLIIEDLIDSGRTLQWIRKHLESKGCASIRTVCLLDKKCRREVNFVVDYVGFEIPDEFVVGYGMDFADEYRGLPFVGVLKPEAYAKH